MPGAWRPLPANTFFRLQFRCCFLREAFHDPCPTSIPGTYLVLAPERDKLHLCTHPAYWQAGVVTCSSPIPRAQQNPAHSRRSKYVCRVGPNDRILRAKGFCSFWKDMKISDRQADGVALGQTWGKLWLVFRQRHGMQRAPLTQTPHLAWPDLRGRAARTGRRGSGGGDRESKHRD